MTQASRPKRAYDSSKRRAAAQATRLRIGQCARRLFSKHGYGATSIEVIAREAGVSVPTFYVTYGSKRAVLFALLDAADAQADVASLQKSLRAAAGQSSEQLRLLVSFARRFYEQSADLIEIARSASRAEADLEALWEEGEARRLKGQKPIVHAWANSGILREGLQESDALDILWSLTGPDHYRLMVTERRWPPEKYETWLTRSLALLLFRFIQ
ncbi:MAG TPA: helix-turn-helix domain-containing protein [Bryobacteraceae bacterium]|nr:helix-turn-helix domain-containing protein [Bryobacteraceae bacterium]